MSNSSYTSRRGELEAYFDRTAVEAWARLTSDSPVGKIRATVRAGRDQMRAQLLECLSVDLKGQRVLDAGCGTGALAMEAARRGAEVVAVDISPTLVGLAQERTPKELGGGRIDFRVGDMLDPKLGRFDQVVAMDSLIHYRAPDMVAMIEQLAMRSRHRVVVTFAPRTPLLTLMHWAGRLFPRANRAPAIEPISPRALETRISRSEALRGWRIGRTGRIKSAFYISQYLELVRV
ncbi:MAG: magnesium protoporphyrin IX methyltransferase [Deltaproteobacteria bacterium]|nr:magnesium protoporphyrin IX methyltransferase [Deltaproteobacteria bacterium]